MDFDITQFETLFRDNYANLCRYACDIVGDMDDAEDIVSEAFSTLWGRRHLLDEGRSIKSYMYVMLRNSCITFLSHHKPAIDLDRQEIVERLAYVARQGMYGAPTDFWFNKCVEYLRFIAYNNADRDDARIHYEYARVLETVARRTAEGKPLPPCLLAPPASRHRQENLRHPSRRPETETTLQETVTPTTKQVMPEFAP